jgi:hypothetical protein
MQLPSKLERSSPYSPQQINCCPDYAALPQKGHQGAMALPNKLKGGASALKFYSAPTEGQFGSIMLPSTL